MLTKVILDGVLGRKFGRNWELSVQTTTEALRLINANKPGLLNWIKSNAALYDRYKVICTYENGHIEYLDEASYGMERRVVTMRFVPVPEGAGGVAKAVIGVAMIIVGTVFPGPWSPYLIHAGAAMALGGIIEALTPLPKKREAAQQGQSLQSQYFNGPVSTVGQGSPVSLIYGRCLVGSQAVSAALTIDRLM